MCIKFRTRIIIKWTNKALILFTAVIWATRFWFPVFNLLQIFSFILINFIHHTFPCLNRLIRQNEKWMKAVENVFNPHHGRWNLFICSLHFEKNSFFYSPNGKIRLRPNAIPTKCLSLYVSFYVIPRRQVISKRAMCKI